MARTALDYDTRTKTARAKLVPAEPYYRQIGPGKTLGYIRRDGAPWIVREQVDGRYTTRLGSADADDVRGRAGRAVVRPSLAQGHAPRGRATSAVSPSRTRSPATS